MSIAFCEPDESLRFVRERDQKRPADWSQGQDLAQRPALPAEGEWCWVRVARVEDFPRDGGKTIRHGAAEIAIFHFASRDAWYATQNLCPHRRDNVLARGLLGSHQGEPKLACPLHKKTFSLLSGKGLNDPSFQIHTFPVEIRDAEVWVKLPDEKDLAEALESVGSCS